LCNSTEFIHQKRYKEWATDMKNQHGPLTLSFITTMFLDGYEFTRHQSKSACILGIGNFPRRIRAICDFNFHLFDFESSNDEDMFAHMRELLPEYEQLNKGVLMWDSVVLSV
jgi:hypothetical protein